MNKIAILLFCSIPAFGGEYALLHTGFRIHAQRHECNGASTRIFTEQGTLDVPTSTIAGYELEEYVAPPPAPPPAPAIATPAPIIPVQLSVQDLLKAAAAKHGLRAEFVRSVAAVESNFKADAKSPKGAMGLMQLMPATAAYLKVDAKDPGQNAEAGTRYLKELLERYKDSADPVRFALAAYNAGPAAVDRYHSIPPYRETQAYVEKVLRHYLAQIE